MYHTIISSLSEPSKVLLSATYGALIIAGSMLVPTGSSPTSPTLPAPIVNESLQPTAAIEAVDTSELEYATLEPSSNQTDVAVSAVQQESIYDEVLDNNQIILGDKVYPLREYSIQATPNDPDSGQWWEGAINAPNAWDISTGDNSVLIAVIDTGFALNHEEFMGKWHVNQGEVGTTSSESASLLNCSDRALTLDMSCNLIDDNYDGIVDNESGATTDENTSQLNCTDQGYALDKSCNLLDDDSNGLADDVTGWDYTTHDRSVQAGEVNPAGSGTRHGTYVAAVAAGNTNNGVGIAGVSWNSQILPIQALGDNGSGNSLSVARAVDYAVAQGADVINMSLGGPSPDSYLRTSVQNAIEQGVVVIAATGNDGCNCVSYPANYPEIIAVGAIDGTLDRASFSSYGTAVDISAPGVGLRTATWSSTNGLNGYASGINGTSLATPIVAGAVANLISQQPASTPLQITAALLESADKSFLGATELHDIELGHGRLDLQAASERLATAYSPQVVYSFANTFVDSPNDMDNVYQCEDTVKGASGIYSLTYSDWTFVSSSLTAVYFYETFGYSSNLLAYGCVLQQHDTPAERRSINTAAELLDVFIK